MNIQIRVLTTQARAQLAQLNTQLGALNRAFGVAGTGARRFGSALGRMDLESFGSRVQWIGRQLDYNFTLPILAAGVAATKWALDNEAAMARVIKVYGDGVHNAEFYRQEVAALEKAFESLSNKFGVHRAAVIGIAADWAAAGATGLALAKAVKLTLETMILGEMEAVEATKALISIQAQYGQSTDELIETIAYLNMVENQTGITLAGLVEGFGRAAGVARSAGVDVRHLAAMLAAISPAAGSAAQAGNALKTIFSRLLSPTGDTAEVLGLIGINLNSLSWQSASMVDRLGILASRFEDLSDSQRNYISSVIASRWQINRFDILMRELVNSQGYYQRALDATADKQRVFTQMQYELNTVLSSSPRRLQIIWVSLQNAAANIIQPMLPAILGMAQGVQTLVQRFSEIDPAVQKLILTLLLLLALLGPIVRLFGAINILLGVTGTIISKLFLPFILLGRLFKSTGALGQGLIKTFGIIGIALAAVLGPAMKGALAVGVATSRIGWAAIIGVWRASSQLIVALVILASRGIALTWNHFAVFLGTLAGTIWFKGIIPTWKAGQTVLLALTLPWATAIGKIWRTLMAGLVLVTTKAFWVGIVANVAKFIKTGLIPLLLRAGAAIIAALASPWAAAITAVVLLLTAFWDKVKQAMSGVRNAIVAGWNALPQSIQNALSAVVRTIAAAVRVIREWLSYLNPFARHSPSLVDNVTLGVAEIVRQYKQLSQIDRILARSGRSINEFGESFYKAIQLADEKDIAEQAQRVSQFAPNLSGDFGVLVDMLRALRAEMGDLASSYPYEQAQAFSNAIFENDQDVKRLRLQLMQMEDAVGPLSDLENRLQAINGAIELTSGTQKALRDAGAGSEILSHYDQQLDMLRDQKSAIEDQMRPLVDLTDQIEQLERIGERLKLEESLALDPIIRQMEHLKNAIRGVEDALAAVASVASAAESAMGGSGGGGGLPPAADYPDPGGLSSIGREGGIADQAALIDEWARGLASDLGSIFSGFDLLSPIRNAWNRAKDWMRTNIAPAWNAFWGTLKENLSKIDWGIDFGGALDAVKDAFASIGDFLKIVWDVLSPAIMEIGRALWDGLVIMVEKIWPKLQAIFKPLGDLLKVVWDLLKPIVALLAGAFLLALSVVANVVANVLIPAFEFVSSIIGSFLDILRGIIDFIVGVFTGDWERAWDGVVTVFKGIFDGVIAFFRGFGEVLWGIASGIIEGILDFFKGLGVDIVEALKRAWDAVFQAGKDLLGAIWNGIKWIWDNTVKPFFVDFIGGILRAIGSSFMRLVEQGKEILSSIWRGIKEIWNNEVKPFFSGLIGTIAALLVVQPVLGLYNIGKNIILAIKSGAQDAWEGFKGWLSGLFDGGDIIDMLKRAIQKQQETIARLRAEAMALSGNKASGGSKNWVALAEGARIDQATLALIGEGRKGFPEYVIPTDPNYRSRMIGLLRDLFRSIGPAASERTLRAIGVPGFAKGVAVGKRPRPAQMHPRGSDVQRVYNFYGNLEFPNIKDGNDAEEFLRNLEALVGDD